MKRFILLRNHTDAEMQPLLQHFADAGWFVSDCQANLFNFTRSEPAGTRAAVVTFPSVSPDRSMKAELYDYTQYLKTVGWKVIAIGPPENIFDSQRHVFIVSQQKDNEVPRFDAEMALKAQSSERKSVWQCLLLLVLFVAAAVLLITQMRTALFTRPLSAVLFGAATLFFAASLVFFAKRLIGGRQESTDMRVILRLDDAMFFVMIAVFLLIIGVLTF